MCIILWTTLAAAICSAGVGGDCSDREASCSTVSLDREK